MPFDGVSGGARWQIDIMAADKTAQAFSSVDRRIKATNATMAQMHSGLTQQIGALARTEVSWAGVSRALGPIAGLLSAVNQAQRAWNAGMAAANLPDQAAQLGTTADALQGFRAVAALSGVEAGQFDTALQRLIASMGAARDGSDDAIERFDRLGVKLLDAHGNLRGVNDVLPEVARGLLRVGSEAERNALAQELFGRSGARTVTMLEALAQGTDEVTRKAREQGMLLEGEYIDAWKKVDDEIKAFNLQYDVFLAKVAAPIATEFLEVLNGVLRSTRKEIEAIGRAWDFVTNQKPIAKQIEAMDRDIAAFKERGHGDDSAVLQDLINRRDALQRQLDQEPITMPVITITPDRPGVGQPTGKGAAKAGEDLAKKHLEESKKLLDEMLNDFEKIRQASEGVMDRFGNGAAFATREMAELNEMLQLGYIDAQTFNVAALDITRRAEDMDTAFRGAQGGLDGFLAGIEHAANQWERTSSTFEMGQEIFTTSIDIMSQAITDFVTKGELDFNRLLGSFVNMLAQMALQEAASGLAKTGISILGGFLGGGGGIVAGSGMTFADGGRPPTGLASIVGEEGPELFVPDRPGTIYNQEQLAGMGGGGDGGGVTIQQTMYFGSDVNRATLKSWGDQVKRETIAAVQDKKRRGSAGMRAAFS